MGNTEIVVMVVLGLLILLLIWLSLRHFQEKGFLLNNAYLYRSQEGREKLNKKPYYRQSAIIFALLALAFLLTELQIIVNAVWLISLPMIVIAVCIVYALVSTALIAKNNKDNI